MSDDNEINIEGIDHGELLAALHNGTRAIGMGAFQDIGRPMTAEEARAELPNHEWKPGVYDFDYFHGRPLKVSFDAKTLRSVWLYDRDAGEGACARAVEQARAAATKAA